MGILTIILVAILTLVVISAVRISTGSVKNLDQERHRLGYIKSVGLFGLIFGILGQLIGLYQAFGAIQQMGEVSPAILAGGLKVSMISALYGFVIFIIAYLMWFALSALMTKSQTTSSN